ncbi:MAG: rhamnan synthesis F family protein [Pseudomonadota bacterium]
MRALIFSHYSGFNARSSHVGKALAHYQPHTDEIIFVSTSPLSFTAQQETAKHCTMVIERENVGYDFMSWKTGLEALVGINRYDEIIIANDSVIGPLADTKGLFARLRDDPRDVCGLTLSWEQARHVQSYFVRFNANPLRSGAFDDFWHHVTPLNDKQDVIDRYELKLTAFMSERGHTTGALYESPRGFSVVDRLIHWARQVDRRRPLKAIRSLRRSLSLNDLNPSIDLWRDCLDAGVPYVKRELLRDNPPGINIDHVIAHVEQRYGIEAAAMIAVSRT